jgi:hypothetical protein
LAFTKSFDGVVAFGEFPTPAGDVVLPLIKVSLPIIDVSLLFDTGATGVILRDSLAPFIGATEWDEGDRNDRNAFGSSDLTEAYDYDNVDVEVFGRPFTVTVSLMELPPSSVWHGVLGRGVIMEAFGFGYYEAERAIYVGSPA